MKRILVVLGLLWAVQATAKPPALSSPKDLAKEANRLEQLADQETDATQQRELRKKACDTWGAAYEAGQRIEYQLSIGACKQELRDLEGAEAALKLFLLQAPANHQDRPIAEKALEQLVAERQAKKVEATPPALTLTGPVPIEESKTQWKRRALYAGGTLAGLGLVGGAIAFGVLRAQEEPGIPIGQGGTAVEIP